MQRGVQASDADQPTRIADLRASVNRAKADKPPKPPKPPKKASKRESDEERAAKAEKQAWAQHTTSLLKGGNSKKPYERPGERAERRGSSGGLLLQLVVVVGLAGGVAYALDPSIVPPEWTAKAHEFISRYITL